MIRRLIFLLLVISINMYGCFVFAATQPSIGMAISVQGQVIAVNKENQKRVLQRCSSLYLHDKIVTQQASKVQFKLWDDSLIVMQPSSEFCVSEFSFDKKSPRNNKYVGNIVKGALIHISGKGKNYQLKSPLTTIAAHGTRFATKLIAQDKVLTNQKVYVFEGSVNVSNRWANVSNTCGRCVPSSLDIGVGLASNIATVNMMGKIQGIKGSGLLGEFGDSIKVKNLGDGGIDVSCRCQ
jgi:hypothetical protein